MTKEQNNTYSVLADGILELQSDSPVLVAISGKDGSGKTTMADKLAVFMKRLTSREIIRISIDDFMNKREVRYTPTESAGRSCYEYTFNMDSFKKNVLEPLQPSGSHRYRSKVFDHATDAEQLSPIRQATSSAIVIIDGVFLFKEELNNCWNLRILLSTDDETAIERGAHRDAARLGSYEAARQKYVDRYIASQKIYYDEEHPEQKADIIIDNNDIKKPKIYPAM